MTARDVIPGEARGAELSADGEGRQRQARALARVAWALALAAVLTLIAGFPARAVAGHWPLVAATLFLVAGFAGIWAGRVGRVDTGCRALVVLLVAGFLVAAVPGTLLGYATGAAGVWLLAWFGVLVLAAGLLLGRGWAIAVTAIGLAAFVVGLVAGVRDPGADTMPPGAVLLIGVALTLFAYLCNLVFMAIAQGRTHAQELQRSLWQTRATLQGQVEERTRALALAARIGRQITRIHDLDTLLTNAVDIIRERFGLYHVQIYLLNPLAQELVLRAATGDAGAQLLRQHHRLSVGPGSINGTAAANQQPIVVPLARRSPLFLSNPLLPETQSEMAIPMVVEDVVVGILDLQSNVPEALNTENLPVFTILAAQLATAVHNARLFAEITETREQLARQAEMLTRSGWERFLEQDGREQPPAGGATVDQGIAAGTHARTPAADHVQQPIAVRGTTIGYLELAAPGLASPKAHDLTAAVATQLGAHLENLRLTQQAEAALDEARRREEELALVNQVVTTLAATSDLASSLQLIVDQLANATGISQVGIAILNDERTAVRVVADRSGQLNTDSAVGFVIPIENNPATQMAIAERRPVIVPHATESPLTASAHNVLRQRGVKTILILPLVVENEVIGTVGLDVVEEGIELTVDQLRLAETIVYQAATTIARARLFQQTEQARHDAERLYTFSAALNAVGDMDEILVTLVESELVTGASSASLATLETDANGRPHETVLTALWIDPTQAGAPAADHVLTLLGARLALPTPGLGDTWLEQPNEPLLFEDVTAVASLDPPVRAYFAALGARALMSLPLQVSDRWVGVVTVTWPEPRRFDSHDRRLYQSMAAQLAVTLSNQQLFEQVRARSRQLERLSRVEADLSLASTEDEILLAMAGGLPAPDDDNLPTLELTYLTTRVSDGALLAEPVSRRRGESISRPPAAGALLRDLATSDLWLDRPRDLLVIEDALNDPRLDEAMRAQAEREGWSALALLPLRRGGQWQGLFIITWPAPHAVSADELFLLQRLHEPLAATVAGRRAYLAQRMALAQTEALYNVSARLNMAQSYDDVLTVIRQHTELGRAADALQFVHFDRPWTPDRPPEAVSILAQWDRDESAAARRSLGEEQPVRQLLRGDRPTVFADIRNDPRLDRATRAALHGSGVRSAVFAPLIVGGQWIGYISLLYRRVERLFDETEVDALSGLIGQVAVAAQTILLLEQTRQLLGSEQRQRRIADTLLTTARVMSETLDETVLRDVLAAQLCETAPGALFVNLYEWLPGESCFRLDRRVEQPDYAAHDDDHTHRPVGALYSPDDRPDLWQAMANNAGQFQPSAEPPGEFYRLPWRVGRQPAGVVEVFRAGPTPQELPPPLTTDDQRRCEGIIQQAALAIQNAQSYGQTQLALADQARLSAELRAVSDVSLAAVATLDTDRLLAAAVDLTRESFELYHAHIYLLDESRTTLVLRAGSGPIGRRMLREGREIPLTANSIVARAARERNVVVVGDTHNSSDFLPHPLLPQTRSEMAVPLIIGERLLGVLDVQSDQLDRFQPGDVLVHKILAAQLAVATQNAHSFAEQLRTAEKLREVDRLKTDFLARMSHELRTPLNSIIGFADVLLMGLDGDLTERMLEDLQLIRSSGYHLRDIIGDILDMSRIEAGRLELSIESFDIQRVTGELMATAAPLAEQKGLTLKLDIADDVGPLVADRTRIRQVLWNIVGNAIKFTDRGQIRVEVRRDNGEVLFSISDTGIGIAEEHLPRIFDHFSQVDPGRRGSISGTGLGLSISKSLVELHGGHITVESEPGQGSIFRFTIPSASRGGAGAAGKNV